MKPRKGRAITFCWCRCSCHDLRTAPGALHGDLICAHQTRNGRCAGCIRECNAPRTEDYPK